MTTQPNQTTHERREGAPEKRADPLETGAVPRLYQRAFGILANQIGSGAIPAGSRLGETTVAAQFGISRAPARLALAELQRSGLIEKSDGRGYTVRSDAPARHGATAIDRVAPADHTKLHSLSSWERIYGEVEGEIAARTAFATWRVNEAVLARHYNVSRTVARDVVARLQQRGVVSKDERSRWYAPALTREHIGELYELRWLLEPVALTKAAAAVPDSYIARMRAALEDAVADPSGAGGPTLDELEEQMHVTLLGHCGNHTLMQAITLPQSLLIAHRFLYRWTPRLFESEPFLPEHLEIVLRLEAGRVDEAARLLERHLRVSLDRAVARVEFIVREFQPDALPYLERMAAS